MLFVMAKDPSLGHIPCYDPNLCLTHVTYHGPGRVPIKLPILILIHIYILLLIQIYSHFLYIFTILDLVMVLGALQNRSPSYGPNSQIVFST
jgi:hypothetical protein